jgi:starch-binding outer membrane protein, SusD/RagB family
MKNFRNKLAIITTGSVIFLGSCVGDLEVTPIDPNVNTASNVYTDTESYKAGLAKLYAAFALTGQQGPAGALPGRFGI